MRIDSDIMNAVNNFNKSSYYSSFGFEQKVNKIFAEVTTLLGYLWNFLTLGYYFSYRTEMIKDALHGNTGERLSPNWLREEAARIQALNEQAWKVA